MTESWMDKAACKGMGPGYPFYPRDSFERQDQKEARESRAKAICGMCAVREACLEYALKMNDREGIWGGLNGDERRLALGYYVRPTRSSVR